MMEPQRTGARLSVAVVFSNTLRATTRALLLVVLACLVAPDASARRRQPDERGVGVKQTGQGRRPAQTARPAAPRPELILQTGYGNLRGPTRFVFSPDARLLATSAFGDGNVKLWEVATGRELRVLSGRGAAEYAAPLVAFSHDGRLVAASGGDNTIKVWEVATGREVCDLAGPSGGLPSAAGVSFMSFAADGRTLVAVGDAIRTWDVVTGAERGAADLGALGVGELGAASAAAPFGAGAGFALSPDGARLAVVGTEGSKVKVKFLDTATGREAESVKLSGVGGARELRLTRTAFGPGGRFVVAGVDEGKLKVWDAAGKAQTLAALPGGTSFVGLSPGGEVVAAALDGYKLRTWDAATGRELLTLDVPHGDTFKGETFFAFGFSRDAKLVAAGGLDAPPALWDAAAGKLLRKLEGNSNVAYNVSFSPDGARLLSGARTLWDLRTGQGLRVVPGAGRVYGSPTADGKLVAVITPNQSAVRVVETATARTLHTLAPAGEGLQVAQFATSPDGRLLAVKYARTSGEPRANPGADARDYAKAYREAMKRAEMDPADFTKIYNEQLARSGGVESRIKIWDVPAGREVQTIAATPYVRQLHFGADGRRLVVLGTEGDITSWDVATGARLRSYGASAVAPSPAGAAGGPTEGRDGSIDTAAVQKMLSGAAGATAVGGGGGTAASVALSPDGSLLAAGGALTESNFDPSALMSLATSRRMKPEEYRREAARLTRNVKVVARGQVVLYDAATGRQAGVLGAHARGVERVAFSADGKLLATAATDNTIKLWDVATRRELRTLAGHTANVNSLAFSPDRRLLASAGDDGATLLWDTETGELLATLVSLFDGGDWLVVTPEGLFDGSPRAWNQILWRYNGDTFEVAPIEWFFNEFYSPGLLSDIFRGKRPRVASDISQKDRRQPSVALKLEGAQTAAPSSVTTREVKVRVEVADAAPDAANPQGSGARDVRLFRNGSLVKVWRGDVLKGRPSVVLEAGVPVVAGENRLVAYAFNRDNVKSKDAPLNVRGDDTLRRAGTLYVLAVGVDAYANPQFNLKYAVADAREFGAEVARQQAGLKRFARTEVVPLFDRDATKANVLDALGRLAGAQGPPSLKAGVSQTLGRLRPAEPEDAVVIFFAGHGVASGQRFYLIPHDLGYKGGRAAIDDKGLRQMLASSISDEELETAVEGLDAGQTLLVIDACNSGQALEAEEKRRGPMNSKGLAQLAYEKGMYILTAAQSYQAALEAAQLGHGYLTYALVEEGLKAAAADGEPKDGTLFAREWFDYAARRVPVMQGEKMKQARGLGLQLAFVDGEERIADADRRSVQRPRVFYRRELETNPLVVAKPAAK